MLWFHSPNERAFVTMPEKEINILYSLKYATKFYYLHLKEINQVYKWHYNEYLYIYKIQTNFNTNNYEFSIEM